jgi:hypothetical protein
LFPVKIELVFDRRPSCYLGCPSHMLSVPNWYSAKLKKHIHHFKDTIYVRNYSIKHIVSLWELIQFLKGILAATWIFLSRDMIILFQIGLWSRVDETHVSFEWTESVLEAGASRTLFPYVNELVFAKEASCLGYSR